MTRVAIVGAGIAGLAAAHRLVRAGLAPTVFEAGDRIGGHTATVDVEVGGRRFAVDTGFIVFNRLTYPRLCALFDELGVASRPTTMSFGVRDPRTGLEYSSRGLRGWFAQAGNLARLDHWRLLAELARFNRVSRELLGAGPDAGEAPITVDDYLARRGFSTALRDRFLIPMAAAIWSAPAARVGRFPARSLVAFFANHRFLDVARRPVWRVVTGGSRRYLAPLTRGLTGRVRVGAPIERMWRRGGAVELAVGGAPGGGAATIERFDHVVVACHSDQALALLADPSPAERAVLGALPYQRNQVVLHTDAGVLPRRRRARAAWNYLVTGEREQPATVTYDLRRLQHLDAPEPILVTLNPDGAPRAIDPARVLGRFTYHHPLHTVATPAAQARWAELGGPGGRTHYAGAYWSWGFHEDGVRSGQRAADAVLAARRADPGRRQAG